MESLDRKDKKKARKLRKASGIIVFILIAAGLGFLMGWLSGGLLENFFEQYIRNDKLYIEIFNISLILLIFIIIYIIHIIIHEGGHLVFGLLSGYEFISFRVGSFTLIREDGSFKSKRFNIPGTAGQCLMMPPEKKEGNFPFILYNLGGALGNMTVSLVTILISVSLKELSWLKVTLVISSAVGLFTGLTNIIPFKIGGIANDGHNIITAIRDKDSRDSLYLQLRVNGLLSRGIRIKDMDYNDFLLRKEIDYENPLNFGRIFINHNYHLDNMDFAKAREALDFGERHSKSTIEVYKMELRSESLFLELIGECDSEKIESLYNKKLRKYIKASKFMLNKKRIMMAYELLYKKDKIKALEYFEELKSLASIYPIKGEARMELMLGEYLKEHIKEADSEGFISEKNHEN